ncbi:MAG: hypothetical protein Q4D98_12100 [Planctomycetia bacterium]|nr:hypothetical protein [Planctomycetia bacterium]
MIRFLASRAILGLACLMIVSGGQMLFGADSIPSEKRAESESTSQEWTLLPETDMPRQVETCVAEFHFSSNGLLENQSRTASNSTLPLKREVRPIFFARKGQTPEKSRNVWTVFVQTIYLRI